MHGFLIVGTNSGCGKTTVTMGLMALLKSLGKKIAPFKVGPDYIDPLFHQKVTNSFSYNLDSYMLPKNAIRYLFNKHTDEEQVAVVEGVMGMYDGMGKQALGSSYSLSRILDLPVILVVNCRGLYQSIVAIINGFVQHKKDSNIRGIILNQVPNDHYYQVLKPLIEDECQTAVLGYLPRNNDFVIESRHLGLLQAEEVRDLEKKVKNLQSTLKNTIDVDKLFEVSTFNALAHKEFSLPGISLEGLNIGVAYDKAFRFYYRDNLELLEELGAQLSFFSPLSDEDLPDSIDCLYIGGGYPEVFGQELQENKQLLMNIRESIEKGMPVYAECGGLMYLTKKIKGVTGKENNMVGAFDVQVQMTDKLQRFGYASLDYEGVVSKCHEFHHSRLIEPGNKPNFVLKYKLNKPGKSNEWSCGLYKNNCLAAYAHVHFYSSFDFFKKIVALWKQKIT